MMEEAERLSELAKSHYDIARQCHDTALLQTTEREREEWIRREMRNLKLAQEYENRAASILRRF